MTVNLLFKLSNLTLFVENKIPLISDLNLEVFEADRIGIRGPSGSGKSTLIRLLLGGPIFYHGDLLYKNEKLPYYLKQLRKESFYVCPEDRLLEESVQDVLSAPFSWKSIMKAKHSLDWKKVYELLDLFKMPKKTIKKRVSDLSTGECQRIKVIRGLILEKKIWFCDEVTSSLDPENSKTTLDLLKKNNCTVISISHDPLWFHGMTRSFELEDGKLEEVNGND